MLILLITLIYLLTTLATIFLLPHMSVPILLFSLYVLPLIINFIGYKLKQLKCKTFLTFLLPTMSLLLLNQVLGQILLILIRFQIVI